MVTFIARLDGRDQKKGGTMKVILTGMLAAGLTFLMPAVSAAHGGKGAINQVDAGPGSYPASTGHGAVTGAQENNPTTKDTSNSNPHKSTPDAADPPGLDD